MAASISLRSSPQSSIAAEVPAWQDAAGMRKRMDAFLAIAARHNTGTPYRQREAELLREWNAKP
jgi:hypothetical protein